MRGRRGFEGSGLRLAQQRDEPWAGLPALSAWCAALASDRWPLAALISNSATTHDERAGCADPDDAASSTSRSSSSRRKSGSSSGSKHHDHSRSKHKRRR